MDHHWQCLENLCRICGSRFSRNTRRSYLCSNYAERLKVAFGVNICNDQKEVHPKSFCTNCLESMKQHEDRLRANIRYLCTLSPKQWLPHEDDSCATCQLHDVRAKGGRPKKGKQLGRPPQAGPDSHQLGTSALVHSVRIVMQQLPSFCGTNNMKLQPVNFVTLQPPLHIGHFICEICSNVMDQPVELSCSHIFCGECLVEKVQCGNIQCHTAGCKTTVTLAGIKMPSDLFMLSLRALQYKCTNGNCNTTVPLQNLSIHLSICTGVPASLPCASTPSRITLRQVLDANSTPSTIERRAMGHLTQRLMKSSSEYGTDNTITVPTGGQV